MLTRPPLLREAAATLPELAPLRTAPDNVRIFGSAMWQALTKKKYLHIKSDIDLIWDLRPGDDPANALEFFQTTDALLPGRIDGEIRFPAHGEVAWREWAGSGSTVLVKSSTDAVLVPREFLLERHNAQRRCGGFLADAAVEALVEELELYPKPGLVSRHDSGSHSDMDYSLMRKSAESLREFFSELEKIPGDFRECLKPIGIRAERRMLEVTGGVNTHRGAIFLFGLLIAAASRARDQTPAAIRESLLRHYGPALLEHEKAIGNSASHGAAARRSHGWSGARGEAAAGFPSVFELALPHFDQLRAEGVCRQPAALETFILLVSRAADSNLLHRGGMPGATRARESALRFLRDGGARRPGWFRNLQALHAGFVRERLSPGGCADLLAAVLFLDRVRCGATKAYPLRYGAGASEPCRVQ